MSGKDRKKKRNGNTSKDWKPARAAKSGEKRSAESCNIGDASEAKCPLPRLRADGKRQISFSFVCLSEFCCPLSVPVSRTLYVAPTRTEGGTTQKSQKELSANKTGRSF